MTSQSSLFTRERRQGKGEGRLKAVLDRVLRRHFNRQTVWRHSLLAILAAASVLASSPVLGQRGAAAYREYGIGPIELEVHSAFSHIRIRKNGDVRTLLFVDEDGVEIVESAVDLQQPHDLLVPYTRYMFASYLFREKQERVLIVGLGGGAMIHFLEHFSPSQRIDVVEIDPTVVGIAQKFFGIHPNDNVAVYTVDGFEYLAETNEKYDVIYMDAFLRPCRDTGNAGIPVRLKTVEFLRGIQSRLQPRGIVVFNLHSGELLEEELSAIRAAFPETYLFRVPARGNRIVVAAMARTREQEAVVEARARQLDGQKRASFSFQEMARQLQP